MTNHTKKYFVYYHNKRWILHSSYYHKQHAFDALRFLCTQNNKVKLEIKP